MHIRRATRTDLVSINNIGYDAWMDNELNEYLWPYRKQYPTDYYFDLLRRVRKSFVSPGNFGVVVVADKEDASPSGPVEGEVMGFAWYIRVPHGDEYDPERTPMSATADRETAEAQMRRDMSVNADLFAALERTLLGAEDRYRDLIGDRCRATDYNTMDEIFGYIAKDDPHSRLPSHWRVSLLGCNPRYEGRGVGSRLVEYGQQLAEGSGVPLTLTSAPGRAQSLYSRRGMRILDWVLLPGRQHEGGANFTYDPWGVWVKAKESSGEQGKPITGEWVIGKRSENGLFRKINF